MFLNNLPIKTVAENMVNLIESLAETYGSLDIKIESIGANAQVQTVFSGIQRILEGPLDCPETNDSTDELLIVKKTCRVALSPLESKDDKENNLGI